MLGNHLLGLYEKALPPELTWEERLRAVKELGFDYLEISIDEKDERLARLDWTQTERSSAAASAAVHARRLQKRASSCIPVFPAARTRRSGPGRGTSWTGP